MRDVEVLECHEVAPVTPVENLVPLVMEYDRLIAVVDDQRRFLGEIHPAAILSTITSGVEVGEEEPAGVGHDTPDPPTEQGEAAN